MLYKLYLKCILNRCSVVWVKYGQIQNLGLNLIKQFKPMVGFLHI